MFFHNATQLGHIARNGPGNEKRPFVLTRSYFAGSQRIGAMWTGDNAAEWSHLQITTPMLLTQGIAGFAFSGADVGGFFGNPSEELLTRWYQVCQGHSCVDTSGLFSSSPSAWCTLCCRLVRFSHSSARTPTLTPSVGNPGEWHACEVCDHLQLVILVACVCNVAFARRLFGEEVLRNLRNAVLTRYKLLPFLYTLFAEANSHGLPVNRPMWMHYPLDTNVFDMDDQFLVGSDLLVKVRCTHTSGRQ